mmetsp:Transcript_10421/g.11677  ORF Transcript_10421/g.11677 Transcript_10421/m.11677 type:complete len:98 (+) Transcript_10421:170-463(+)
MIRDINNDELEERHEIRVLKQLRKSGITRTETKDLNLAITKVHKEVIKQTEETAKLEKKIIKQYSFKEDADRKRNPNNIRIDINELSKKKREMFKKK